MQAEVEWKDLGGRDGKRRDKPADIPPSRLFYLLILASAAAIFASLSSTAMASPDEAYGTVTNVVDGSTFDIKIDMADSRVSYGVERVRLADVISPEMESLHGPAARDFAFSVLMDKRVYLDIDDLSDDGRDDEGRLVCVVYLTGVYGQPIPYPNFNLLLVKAGQAELSNREDNEFHPANWMDEYQSGEESSPGAFQRLEESLREGLEGSSSGSGSGSGSDLQASGQNQQEQDSQQQDKESIARQNDENDSNSSIISRIENAAKEELDQSAQSAWDWLKGEIRNSAVELVNSSLESALNST